MSLSPVTAHMKLTWSDAKGFKWDETDGSIAYWRLCELCHKRAWPADKRSRNRYSRPAAEPLPGGLRGGRRSLVVGDFYLTEAPPEVLRPSSAPSTRGSTRSPPLRPSSAGPSRDRTRSPPKRAGMAESRSSALAGQGGQEVVRFDVPTEAPHVCPTEPEDVFMRTPWPYGADMCDHCETPMVRTSVGFLLAPTEPVAAHERYAAILCRVCRGQFLQGSDGYLCALDLRARAAWR